jgi:hypothetical protein
VDIGERPSFDERVNRVDRAGVNAEHIAAVGLWWGAARHAYETRQLDQLARLLRSRIPLSPQVRPMLAEIFDLSKLKMKSAGGRYKLFGNSLTANYKLAADDVKRMQTGELKILGEPKSISVVGGLRSLRDSTGHMSREDAIEQIAAFYDLEVYKLTDWIDGRMGASRRKKGRRKKGRRNTKSS